MTPDTGMQHGRGRVGTRLVRLAVCTVAVFFFVMGGISLRNKSELIDKMFQSTGRSISEAAALLMLEPFLVEDWDELDAIARRLVKKENNVSYVVITRSEDNAVVKEYPHDARAELADADIRVFEAPIQIVDEEDGTRYLRGRLAVGLSAQPFTEMLVQEVWTVILQMLICFVILALVLMAALRRWVARPLRYLDRHAGRIEHGDLASPIHMEQDDEFGRLASTFERMRRSLQATYREIQQRNERLTELDRLKSEFLANMSHEIRTPLHGLIGMASVLQETAQTEEQRDCVDVIVSSAEHLVRVVSDILDFSKIEAGQVELERVEFSPVDQLEEVADLLGPRALGKGVELLLEPDPRVPDSVRGDATRLRQIITNLLSNSVKFTDSGEVLVRLEVEEGAKPLLRYTIEDTGVGIDADVLPRLFDPFTQADTSTSRRYGGTGLGLAISRRLVELMGGTIHLESDVGRGTRCSFVVPLDIVRPARPAPDVGDSHGVHVMCVEPHEGHRRHLRQRLEQMGLRCTALSQRAEAREALDGRTGGDIRLVIVAVRDHGDLKDAELKRLLSKAREQGASVVAVIPVHDLSLRRELRQLGIEAVLVKPLRRAAVLEQVAKQIGDGRGPASEEGPDEGAEDVSHRVLVVDDSDINRRVACSMLKKLGHESGIACGGEEALTQLASGNFDLVLLDIQMPEIDGYEVARRFRIKESEANGAHMPIVAMTAHATPEDRARCLDHGMDDFVTKPVNLDRLRSVLARWLPHSS